MYLQKVISKKYIFVGILKVKDENRIRIRIHWTEARIRGYGSVTKRHGTTTLSLMAATYACETDKHKVSYP